VAADLEAVDGLSKSTAADNDSLSAVLDDIRSADEVDAAAEVETGAANEALGETEGEPLAEEGDTEAPVWQDEQLLALDDLRSYIDADNESPRVGGSAPEWLDDLTDGSDVTGELPQWLHEAVGFEAPDSSAVDLPDPHIRDSASSIGGQGQASDLSVDEEPLKPGDADAAELNDIVEAELGYTGRLSHDASAGSTVPDWLLEGDDVLDELAGEFLDTDAESSVEEGKADDRTMTWLDELSEQLAEGNEGGFGQGASSRVPQDGDFDESPTDG
jgi:hypothetical protein